MVSMNHLDASRRTQIVKCLIEGMSIRSTVRLTGASKNTVAKLVVELGAACTRFMNEAMVNLPCKRIQCDEIWSFVYAKEKNVTEEIAEKQIAGSVWIMIHERTQRNTKWSRSIRGIRGFLTGALALERVDRVNQMDRALGQQPGDKQVKR